MVELREAVAEVSGDVVLQDFSRALGGDVAQMEDFMLAQEQVDCPVIHRFGPGVYIREVKIPAGTVAVGHHQNFEHMNVVLQGRVTILHDNGSTSEVAAPAMYVGKPGRKIGYVHEDLVWLNIYPTSETDIDVLESRFITKSDVWTSRDKERLMLAQQRLEYHADYQAVLDEYGFTEEVARQQSENQDDMVDLPMGGYKIKVAPSSIEGRGLIATAGIEAGERIAPARIDGKRTIAGRFTNHSPTPNAKMVRSGQWDIDLVALRPIKGCQGGFDGEEITVDYRQALALNFEIGELQ